MRKPWLRLSAVVAASCSFTTLALQAQDPAARPKFEVASIKECKDRDESPPSISSPGRLGLSCWPLWRLIGDAYETFATGKVDPLKLLVPLPPEGAPAWVNSAHYTIDAKAEGAQSGAMMRGPMMQALLEERFQLKTHRENKEISGYIMTVARGGSKLKPTGEDGCHHLDPTDFTQSLKEMQDGKPSCLTPSVARTGPLAVFDAHGMTLDVFCSLLHPNGRPVINQTGLTGAFDIHFEWEPSNANAPSTDNATASDPAPHASDIQAIRQQLGLRLDAGKGTRNVLVIDRIEKPSAN